MPITSIDNAELKQWLGLDNRVPFCLLDVRTVEEWTVLGHIRGAKLMPMHQVLDRVYELDPKEVTVIICQHGIRSTEVAAYLDGLGFSNVRNHVDGMAAWDGPLDTVDITLPMVQ